MFGLKIQSPVGWGQTEFHYMYLQYIIHACFREMLDSNRLLGRFTRKERHNLSYTVIHQRKNLPLTARDLGIEVKDKTTLSIINQVCTKSFEALQQLLQKSQLLPSRPAILSLQTKYLGQTAAWRSKQKNNSKLLLCKTFCNFDQFWINIRRPVHAQTQLAELITANTNQWINSWGVPWSST